MEFRGISRYWDVEDELQLHLRLAKRGVSQTSQEGLKRGAHTPTGELGGWFDLPSSPPYDLQVSSWATV